ncbi:hypothetical protein [Streptococcus mitis]|uniref:Uncharacterized protein n=1 Tax=Streptococcus mitis TaxID=28037 RepID=A0A1X1JTS4_STRMT|nr:hypothetical protein [Streptococcus mitis]ORO90487.1 hypothetical protein B7702_02190 [Streptococcus mitis]ORO90534.1 hypothetical protein B7702_02435 [Streptococcus mitis]
MGFDKKELIKGYQHTIEQNEEKIIEYSKPCDSRKRRIRALERDLLKKKNKELREKVEELEDEC